MKNTDKRTLFEDYPVPKAIKTLVLPTVISSLVTVIYSLADTYFVGLLNDAVQTAAVSLAAPAMLAFYAINNLFGVGTSSAMSRALGRGDESTAKKASVFGFYCALMCASLYALVTGLFQGGLTSLLGADESTFGATKDYLFWAVTLNAIPGIMNVVTAYLVRSEGSSLHASIGTMSGCILNIILDPIFIMPWGLGMGAAGAGLATFISNTVAMGYFLVLLFIKRKTTLVSINIKRFAFDKAIAKDIFGVGFPAAIQNLLNVTSHTVFNNFASAYGPDVVAAMGIAQKVQMVAVQISLGGSQGVMPFVGYNFSSGNKERMKKSIMYFSTRMMAFIIAASALCMIFGRQVVGMFIHSEAVVTYGGAFLIGFMLAMPFQFVDFLSVGVFQSVGDGKKPLFFAILRKIVLEIPAIIILDKLVPIYGIAYSMLCAEFILSIVAVFMLRKLMHIEKQPAATAPKE